MALAEDLKRLKEINEEIANISRQLNETPKVFKEGDIREAERYLRGLRSELNGITESTKDLSGAFRAVVQEITGQNQGLATTKKSFRSLTSLADKFRDDQLGITKLNTKQLNQLGQKIKAELVNLEIANDLLTTELKSLEAELSRNQAQTNRIIESNANEKAKEKALNSFLKLEKKLNKQILESEIAQQSITAEMDKQNSLSGELLKKVEERRKEEEKIDKDRGVKTLRGIEGLADKLGLGKFSDAFKDATRASEEQARANIRNEKRVQKENEIIKAKNKLVQTQRRADLDALKSGKGLTKEAIKRLGLEKQLVSTKGKGLAGTAAAKKAAKTGAAGAVKPLKSMALKTAAKVSPLKAGLVALGLSIRKLFNPITILAFLIKQLLDVIKMGDKAAGELAKSMNVTYTEALAVRRELTQAAEESGTIAVNTQRMQEQLIGMQQALGTSVRFNTDLLVSMTKFSRVAGFAKEDMVGIAQLTLLTSKNQKEAAARFDETLASIMVAADIVATNLGVQINTKDVAKDIRNVSKATVLSLKGSGKALGTALATAKALGITLQQIESTSESLLNFEQSISSELKAELLIGRNLNLERARLAAINNDIEGVAREINAQLGSAAEFGDLNRIQQKAFAEAVGMTRDELAETLFIQENLKGATGEAAKDREAIIQSLIREKGLAGAEAVLRKKTIKDLEDQASTQEKFNDMMLKLKELLVQIGEPLLELLAPLADLLAYVLPKLTGQLQGVVGIIKGAILGLKSMGMFLAALNPLSDVTFEDAMLARMEANDAISKGFGRTFDTGVGKDSFLADVGLKFTDKSLVGDDSDKSIIPTFTEMFKERSVNPGGGFFQPFSNQRDSESQALLRIQEQGLQQQQRDMRELINAVRENRPAVDVFGNEFYGS